MSTSTKRKAATGKTEQQREWKHVQNHSPTFPNSVREKQAMEGGLIYELFLPNRLVFRGINKHHLCLCTLAQLGGE